MLASRLLSIMLLLQTRGRTSATDLARHFEVSVRTIHRDIDQLSAAGVPVYAERGRSGGFELIDGFRTKLTGLTQPEAEALLLAGLPGAAAQLGLAELLDSARMKLLASLPPGMQAEQVASRFHLDATGWFRSQEAAEWLPTIARAVWSERRIRIDYRRAGAVQARVVAPLGLVLKGGVWYLVAKREARLLTYRVAQVVCAEVLDEPFERPVNFDLADHWKKAARAYELGAFVETAMVRLSPRGIQLLEIFAPHVRSRALETAEALGKAGWVRCQLPIESLEVGIGDLMRLGPEVEVLGPPAVRMAFKDRLLAMSAFYGRET